MRKTARTAKSRSRAGPPIKKTLPGIKARPVRLHESMPIGEARRVTILECLAQVAANIPAIRAREMEGVHQARVGLRRLDVALKAFAPVLVEKEAEALRHDAKTLTDILAQTRDLDVFVTQLLKPVSAATAQNRQALAPLTARAEDTRRKSWDNAIAAIDRPRVAEFLDQAAALAQRNLDGGNDANITVSELADRALDKSLAKARKRAAKLDSADEHDFHRLRIALKKLRYSIEFFQRLHKKDRAKPYLKTIKSALDLLGALHDVTAAREILKQLSMRADATRGAKTEQDYATGLVLGWHGARAERMKKQIVKCWDAFSKEKPFWH